MPQRLLLLLAFVLSETGCWPSAPDRTDDAGPRDASAPAHDASAGGDAGVTGDLDAASPDASSPTGALCGVDGTDQCGSYMVCNAVLGCVECAGASDCPLSAKECVAGACSECDPRADAGCPASDPVCFPQDGSCHRGCTAGEACPPSAPHCDEGTGRCVGCFGDVDCRSGSLRVCSDLTRQCVECTADAHCAPPFPRCDVKQSTCVACSSDADCGRANPVCDPATRRCRLPEAPDAGGKP
jgi:hypothetical protein